MKKLSIRAIAIMAFVIAGSALFFSLRPSNFEAHAANNMALDSSTTATQATLSYTMTFSLSTATSNELIYVSIAEYSSTTVSSIASAGLTWAHRASVGSALRLETWWAAKSLSGSTGTVTVTLSKQGNSAFGTLVAFAIIGADTASPFDPNYPTTPPSATGSGTSSSVSIITSNANDFIIGAIGTLTTPGLTPVSGFLPINSAANSNTKTSDEYKVVSTSYSSPGLSVGYTLGVSATWYMIADAVKQAPAITFTTSGMSSDATGTVLTIDGTNYAYSDLSPGKTFYWPTTSTHQVTATNPVSGGSGKRYSWSSWTSPNGLTSTGGSGGQPGGTFTTPSSDTQVTATYGAQYQLTVTSVHDTPSPASGSWFDANTQVTESVTTPADVSGGTQYRCTGWGSGSGGVPATGSAATVTFTISGPAAITWNWQAQYQLTVTSGHGSPTPSGSSNWYDANAQVTASVGSPADSSGGTQYRCTGWTGTGDVPSSGSLATVTFNINHASSVTWNWQAQYQLTVENGGHGTAGGGDWYDANTYAHATITPLTVAGTSGTQYVFTGWSGAATGSGSPSDNILMDGPKTATATWQTRYYLTVTSTHGGPTGAGWYNASDTASFGVTTPDSGPAGTRYVFTGWSSSDSGGYTGASASHSVTMDNAISETASWQTQYYLTVTSAHGTPSGAGWYDSSVEAHAGLDVGTVGTSGTRYVFTSWGTDASGANYAQSNDITMSEPKTATTGWQTQYELTVDSAYDTPGGGNWYNSGATAYATLTVGSVDHGNGTRHVFTGWGGDASGTNYASSDSITMSGPMTTTANWKTQYYLTVSSSHGTVGGDDWYDSGDDAYATVTPLTVAGPTGTRYAFTGWTGDASGSSSPSNAVLMDGPKTATAVWQTQYELTVDSAHGTPGGGGWYDSGDTAYASVAPLTVAGPTGTQYVFTVWSDDASGSGSPSGGITMDGPKTATAGWKTQYEVTFNVNPGGSGTTSPSGSSNWYDAGSSSNAISASAYSGYFFASWSKTGTIAIDDQASSSTTFTIDSPGTITATFTQSEYLLTVSVDPTGGGSVLANQSAPYSYGDVVNLTATANPGYSFSHWTGDLIGSSNPASITIDDNKTVTAVFTQNTYTLSVTVLPASVGSVIADKPGPYHYGDVVKLTETPADGYSFSGWSGDGSGTGTTRTVTVTRDMDVIATFQPAIFVVPENDLGGLLAIVACFVAFACFAGFYKRKKNYENEETTRRRKIRFAFKRFSRVR